MAAPRDGSDLAPRYRVEKPLEVDELYGYDLIEGGNTVKASSRFTKSCEYRPKVVASGEKRYMWRAKFNCTTCGSDAVLRLDAGRESDFCNGVFTGYSVKRSDTCPHVQRLVLKDGGGQQSYGDEQPPVPPSEEGTDTFIDYLYHHFGVGELDSVHEPLGAQEDRNASNQTFLNNHFEQTTYETIIPEGNRNKRARTEDNLNTSTARVPQEENLEDSRQEESQGEWSDWLTSKEYNAFFKYMVTRKRYPRRVEARAITDGKLQVRGFFVDYPTGRFSFWSFHRLSDQAWRTKDAWLVGEGFRRVWHSSVECGGDRYNQGTWIRERD